MRKNLPITNKEVKLRADHMIVSRTNLKGVIDYVNPDFVEISGFDEAELLGAPHNIVRHPDMPSAAFADLWRNLKAGRPWRGMVKNRCKNGDHYWVEANATPVWQQGRVVSYMSVRRPPTEAQTAAAEQAYRALREGRAGRRRIMHGAVVSTWPWAAMCRAVRDSSLGFKIGLLLSPTLVAMLGIAGLLFGETGYQPEPAALATAFVAGGVLQAWAAAWFWRSIRSPLRAAADALQAVAEGDYSVRLDIARNDEVGVLLQAVTAMQTKLGFIVTEVREASAAMDDATADMAQGSRNLSARTEEQAARLEETAGAMSSLTETVRRNAEHASQANQLAAGAAEVASRGGEVVGEVVHTMNGITESSKKIADIIGVIDGIAYQTNILALNAAVEAARAGEQGRGFAVVANEVRNLAQRSAVAAAEIKTLIEDSVTKVGQGAQQVDRAGRTMSDIVEAVQQVADIMAEITTASAAQSAGLEQVNQAVGQMDQMTQQNAALVEEAAAAVAAMRAQAGTLANVVAHLSDERHAAAHPAVTPPLRTPTPKAA